MIYRLLGLSLIILGDLLVQGCKTPDHSSDADQSHAFPRTAGTEDREVSSKSGLEREPGDEPHGIQEFRPELEASPIVDTTSSTSVYTLGWTGHTSSTIDNPSEPASHKEKKITPRIDSTNAQPTRVIENQDEIIERQSVISEKEDQKNKIAVGKPEKNEIALDNSDSLIRMKSKIDNTPTTELDKAQSKPRPTSVDRDKRTNKDEPILNARLTEPRLSTPLEKQFADKELHNPRVAKPESPGKISGKVTVISKGKTLSPENVLIALEPTDSTLTPVRHPRSYAVEMIGKKYRPRYLHIRVNDSVTFKNLDPFMHNVFSLSGLNKFDLGTYGKGTETQHKFNQPDLVKVYCNIHPTMACFIMVSRSDWSYVTDPDGVVEIENLPPGEYRLTAWNIRGEFDDIIKIFPDQTTVVNILIDGSKYKKKPHLNKFGKRYPKNINGELY